MTIINLTPHVVEVFSPDQFVGLEQTNPTTWVADGVSGDPLQSYPSQGVARISVSTEIIESSMPGEVVITKYGHPVGIPYLLDPEDVLIVSLPMQSMAKASFLPSAHQMVAPYKVVRSRSNGSLVLGCMGFTY